MLEALRSLVTHCDTVEWRELKGSDACLIFHFNKSSDFFSWLDFWGKVPSLSYAYSRSLDDQIDVQLNVRLFIADFIRGFARPWLVNIRKR